MQLQVDPYAFSTPPRITSPEDSYREFTIKLDVAMNRFAQAEAAAELARWRARGSIQAALVFMGFAVMFVALAALWRP